MTPNTPTQDKLTQTERDELDCGDNSCHFAKNKTGMRTNGGCRCFTIHGYSRSAIQSAHLMLPDIIALRKQITALKASLETAVAALEKYALPCSLWFLKGPYGNSPDIDSVEKIREALASIVGEGEK